MQLSSPILLVSPQKKASYEDPLPSKLHIFKIRKRERVYVMNANKNFQTHLHIIFGKAIPNFLVSHRLVSESCMYATHSFTFHQGTPTFRASLWYWKGDFLDTNTVQYCKWIHSFVGCFSSQ